LFDLSQKVAVVTGAGSGIGAAIAALFARQGAHVVVLDLNESRDATAAAIVAAGGSAIARRCNVAEPGEVARTFHEIAAEIGRLHILVNNAGIAWGAPVDTHPVEQIDRVLRVNVRAMFHLTQRLLPLLRAAASAEDPARVINIGSVDGIAIPMTQNYGYSASKAAVHMLTRHLAYALVGDHVNVNAIAPGLFPSRLTRWAFDSPALGSVLQAIPMHRAGTAEDIGGTAIYLASRAGSYLTGVVIPVAGGLSTIDVSHAPIE
jgi:NAD(P)-dependent dehydrogenase (short-subunit alcohol dehydrogenase family)